MRCEQCGTCCTQTQMLLSEADIKRLERSGYARDFFIRFSKSGYAQLRNRGGHCVFYDLKNKCCSVYSERPEGCRLYPVILDESKGIIADAICHAKGTISEVEKAETGLRILRLLRTIDQETEDNKRKANLAR